MGLGHLSIQDCNDEMEMMIRSTKGAVGWSQRYFHLDAETDKLVVELVYNKSIDCLLLFYDDGEYVTLFKDYIPSEDSGYLTKRDGTKWKTGAYTIILFKAVPLEDMKIDGKMIADKTLPYRVIDNLFIHNMIEDLEDNYIIDGKIIKNGTLSYKKMDKNYMTQLIEDLENNYIIDGKVIRHGTISIDQVSNDFLTTINTKIKNASLTEKGVVQLSNSVNSTSEVLAATPKAIKTTYDMAIKGSFFGVATNSSSIQFNANIDGLTYYDGLEFRIVFKTAPTADAKLNINGLGNYNLKIGPDNISDGDIEINIPYTFLKYGNNFFCKASSRGKEFDVPEIADPDNAHLYASVPTSKNFRFVRVRNADEVYTVLNGNLYLLNCKKKKMKELNMKGQFNSYDRIPGTTYLRKWNNMYVYGNKVFNSSYNLIKDFSSGRNREYQVQHYDGGKGSDRDYTTTETINLNDYLVLDSVNNRLFLVKEQFTDEYHNPYTPYREYSNDTATFEYDYYVKIYLEIYEVNNSMNTTLIKTIYSDDLQYGLYADGDGYSRPLVSVVRYPNFYIYSGDYSYKDGTSFSFQFPFVCDRNYIIDENIPSISVIDPTRLPRSSSNHNTYFGLIKYNINNLNDRRYIMIGKCGNHREDLSSVPDHNQDENFYIDDIFGGYGNDRIISMRYNYRRESDKPTNSEAAEGIYLYDIENDTMIGTTQDDADGSKSHNASEKIRLNVNVENLRYATRLTNNAHKWISSDYIHGFEDNNNYNLLSTDKYNYLAITSKYGFKSRNNIIEYRDGINQFYYDMQYSEYNRKRDNYYWYNYARTDALFTLMMKSVTRENTIIIRNPGSWYITFNVNRKLNNYTFKHTFTINTGLYMPTDEEIYNYKDLTISPGGLSLMIGGDSSVGFSISDDTSTLPSTDISKYTLHSTILDIYKF